MTTFQYLDGGNIEAQDRLATTFLLSQTSTGLATTGVLSGLAVTQTVTASDSVLIAAGAAPIQSSVLAGVAFMVNDTSATLEVLTSHPMGGLPRNDIVVMDSVTKALAVIVGTPNATPNDPTVPPSACALARLRHTAPGGVGATTIPASAIDDLRTYTRLTGALGPRLIYVPALTGVTLGNGSLIGVYRLTDGLLDWRVSLTFGSTTTWGGEAGTNIGLGMPSGVTAMAGLYQTASVWINNPATGFDYVGAARVAPGSGAVNLALNAGLPASVHSSRPFVWGTGAVLVVSGQTEVA